MRRDDDTGWFAIDRQNRDRADDDHVDALIAVAGPDAVIVRGPRLRADGFAALAGTHFDLPDETRQLLLVRGAVPGAASGFVTVRPAVKAKPAAAAKGAK